MMQRVVVAQVVLDAANDVRRAASNPKAVARTVSKRWGHPATI